jgi:hypothetical protein
VGPKGGEPGEKGPKSLYELVGDVGFDGPRMRVRLPLRLNGPA